jgi:Icc-related predicted phosphoesterase
MKTYYWIFIILSLFLSKNIEAQNIKRNVYYSQIDCEKNNIECAEKHIKVLKILEIKKQNKIYIITGSDEKCQIYTVLSKKNKLKKHNKIEIDNEYKFFLVPYLDIDAFLDLEEKDYIIRGGTRFLFTLNIEGKIITICNDIENNFYGTPNLDGLYYIPYDETEQNREYPYFRSHANWVKYELSCPEVGLHKKE